MQIELALKALTLKLSEHYSNAEDTEKIVIKCALTATAADAIGGAIPGLAVPATIIGCFGAVWVMYGKLCSTLGISLKKNVLKLLARAALSNIVANLSGAILTLVAGMFIPGGSILASALVSFITVYLAGLIFLRTILSLAEKSSDSHTFSDMSDSALKAEVKNTKVSKQDLDAAKKAYEENKDSEKDE